MKIVKDLPEKKLLDKYCSNVNKIFLESNFNKLEQIVDFFENNTPFMLINGFVGTGKSTLTDCALKFLKDDVITLKYTCFETTVLDDILLRFFNTFKYLTAQKIIDFPKVRTDNFAKKIIAYFDVIKKPVVIVIDSFEQVLQSEVHEILDFLFFVSKTYKIKILITARKFDYEKFNINFDRVALNALDKGLFEKYLKSENIKQIGPLTDELYKNTRGYWFYTALTVKIMKLKNLSFTDFLSQYSGSFLSFSDYILREALSFINPIDGHLIRFLTLMRHPVNINLLKKLNLFDEERIKFFLENAILAEDYFGIYLRDYYKTISENSIAENIAIKIHKSCVELYKTQLPLKPFERDMLISRKTMRREIEYHDSFIPKKMIVKEKEKEKEIVSDINLQENSIENTVITREKKEEQIKKISFVFDSKEDEIEIMNKIAISINNFVDSNDRKQKTIEEIKNLNLNELINLAKSAEKNFDYKKAVIVYQHALTKKEDSNFYAYLPTIYVHLAKSYKSISDWYNSVKNFEHAIDIFKTNGSTEKIYELKYEIANIHYISFKRNKAVEVLNDLINKNLDANLDLKSKLLLYNLTGNWLIKELPKDISNVETKVLCELYFNLGLNYDKNDDIEMAVKYYKKCIETSHDMKENQYLSSALSNLAIIYDDIGKTELAIKYLHESIRIDELNNNFNGVYISSMKLAEIYSFQSKEKATRKINDAKHYAKELNDSFYIASCEVTLGDLCAKSKDYKNALLHYKEAYNIAIDNFTKENIEKIEMRIRDITKVYHEE